MQLIELTGSKSQMGAWECLKFYTSKVGYSMSSISPYRVYLGLGLQTKYEICKTLHHEAKSMLEGFLHRIVITLIYFYSENVKKKIRGVKKGKQKGRKLLTEQDSAIFSF
ncbi:unnamed protein product [Cuscuta epithymum]|uniref:Uncharacterized protein n=1 Tax=Cuscuta epithymum TaxID=186058 RepID=A0AAV0CVM7_9ASTE|nr:unnamed protein product [Cuscuta epithymum]CAH9142285.1 unnamed protein product [Cuscuta epithymum]